MFGYLLLTVLFGGMIAALIIYIIKDRMITAAQNLKPNYRPNAS